jgi:endogenous inhibitor of DNA gyrase (YacG/DUF329 family)
MPGTLKPKNCLVCKKEFQPKAGSQKYCSPTCNGLVHLKRNRSRLDHNRLLKCWICKKEFKPVTSKSRAKFCSAECRAVHFGNKATEKREELEIEARQQVKVKEKWNDASVTSTEVPADSMFPEEILAFINRGGQITQYLNPVWVEGSQPSEYEEDFLTD